LCLRRAVDRERYARSYEKTIRPAPPLKVRGGWFGLSVRAVPGLSLAVRGRGLLLRGAPGRNFTVSAVCSRRRQLRRASRPFGNRGNGLRTLRFQRFNGSGKRPTSAENSRPETKGAAMHGSRRSGKVSSATTRLSCGLCKDNTSKGGLSSISGKIFGYFLQGEFTRPDLRLFEA